MELDLNREILSALENVYAGKKEVKLHNDYKGVPVSYPATIQGFNDQGIVLKVNKYQLVCLTLEKHTFIQSEQLPSIVKASLVNLDFPKTEVTLHNFAYTVDTIGKRAFIRVQPQEPIQAVLNNNVRKIRGQLVDISENGLGVVTVEQSAYSLGLLRRGASILVNFRLPGEANDTLLAGTIRNIAREIDINSYRIGILVSPSRQAHETLVRFIARRKSRILAELEVLYSQLSRA